MLKFSTHSVYNIITRRFLYYYHRAALAYNASNFSIDRLHNNNFFFFDILHSIRVHNLRGRMLSRDLTSILFTLPPSERLVIVSL